MIVTRFSEPLDKIISSLKEEEQQVFIAYINSILKENERNDQALFGFLDSLHMRYDELNQDPLIAKEQTTRFGKEIMNRLENF